MRKDITVEKLKLGGTKVNKTQLARQYGCCWETIDRRLNPEKYQKDKKERIYTSMLDPFKQIIDVNDTIRMYKKRNLEMYKIVHENPQKVHSFLIY